MKFLVFSFILIAISVAISGVNSMKSFRNHKVVTFKIENEQQLMELQSIELQAGVTLEFKLRLKFSDERFYFSVCFLGSTGTNQYENGNSYSA